MGGGGGLTCSVALASSGFAGWMMAIAETYSARLPETVAVLLKKYSLTAPTPKGAAPTTSLRASALSCHLGAPRLSRAAPLPQCPRRRRWRPRTWTTRPRPARRLGIQTLPGRCTRGTSAKRLGPRVGHRRWTARPPRTVPRPNPRSHDAGRKTSAAERAKRRRQLRRAGLDEPAVLSDRARSTAKARLRLSGSGGTIAPVRARTTRFQQVAACHGSLDQSTAVISRRLCQQEIRARLRARKPTRAKVTRHCPWDTPKCSISWKRRHRSARARLSTHRLRRRMLSDPGVLATGRRRTGRRTC